MTTDDAITADAEVAGKPPTPLPADGEVATDAGPTTQTEAERRRQARRQRCQRRRSVGRLLAVLW